VPFTNKILGDGGVDIVAKFEYDLTLLEVAGVIDACIKGSKLDYYDLYDKLKWVKGISYRKQENGKVEIIHNEPRPFLTQEELDKIPFVSKVYKKHLNIYDYALAKVPYPMVQIFSGRGCPFWCTFCAWPEIFTGRNYRPRSVENTVDEMEYIYNKMPEVKGIFFEDDTFAVDKNRVAAIATEMKRRKLKIEWSCYARATLDYPTLKKMKEAGCRLFTVGYESGSDEILKNVKKGITTKQMREFTKNTKKVGIQIHADFIFGLPGETKETIEKTRKFIKEIKPDLLQIAVATPIPGTKFYEYVERNGYLIADTEHSLDEEGYQKCIVSYPWLSDKEIIKAIDDTYKSYYFNPAYIPITLRRILKGGLPELKIFLKSVNGFLKYINRNIKNSKNK